jgi:hypothetical protein
VGKRELGVGSQPKAHASACVDGDKVPEDLV